MLLKPLHLLGEMESAFDIIKEIGFFLYGGWAYRCRLLIFVRYADFSFFMLLKPLHPFHEMESTFGIIEKFGLFFWMLDGQI